MLPFRCASNGQVRIAAVLRDQNHFIDAQKKLAEILGLSGPAPDDAGSTG